MTTEQIRNEIHEKVIELAKAQGNKAAKLRYDEAIPETGLLDSAGLMGLIFWYEMQYSLSIDQQDLTLDNFGTVDAMTEYVLRKRGPAV